jgi:hypothetical protein
MEISMSQNPLASHFRQPAIHLRLPSNGQYWPEDTIDIPVTGELPIYPMTARDEIVIRTPDALLNGSAIVDLIHSCCPSIRDAWSMPAVDVDALLIGIRIASYGHVMDFDSRCPHCQHDNSHALDLNTLLVNFHMPDYRNPVQHQKLHIKLRPQNYQSISKTNRINFEEQQLLRSFDESSPDAREKIKERLESLVRLSLNLLVNSTEYIEIEGGQRVTEQEYLSEFYQNAETQLIKAVQNRLKDINNETQIRPITVPCESCKKSYEVDYTFDYSNFFDLGF